MSNEPLGKPRLLDQVSTAIRVRHYSRRTEEAYRFWIRKYILFHGKKHPVQMRETEIAAFIEWLSWDRLESGSDIRSVQE